MYCVDCGTKLSDGICPNCSEELFIFREQYEHLPKTLSDEFSGKVKEQAEKEKRRNKKQLTKQNES